MAIAPVNTAVTASGAATLAIPTATAGNVLIVGVVVATSLAAPTMKDNLGTSGWTVHESHGIFAASANSLWVAVKTAVGGEKTLEPTTAGSITGLACIEASGCSTVFDGAPVHLDNQGSKATITSPGLTTTDAGDIIVGFVGLPNNSGELLAWTGTGPLTLIASATTRIDGGYYLPGATVAGATYTGNWTTARNCTILVAAIKPAGGAAMLGLAAASSGSAASLAASAPTQLPVGAASSLSAAALAASAPTQVPLGPALAASASSGVVTTSAALSLAPASSASSTVGQPTSPGAASVPLAPASSSSAASAAVRARAGLPLAPASSTSAGVGAIRAPAGLILGALAVSGAQMSLSAPAALALAGALGESGAAATITAPASLALAPSSSTSEALLALTAGGAGFFPARASSAASLEVVTHYIPAEVPGAPEAGRLAVVRGGRAEPEQAGSAAGERAGRMGR